MCGIAGIIQTDPRSFNTGHIKNMTDSLSHRGPDGEGIWQNVSGHVLLGHRRLAIIDTSDAAAQPMHYLDRYTIIHNGEIYNYLELKEDLQKKGYSFRTSSDTEVILAAFDHYYDECIEHFDGMFAFAIWDEEEQELFAARDRFGEKPFYYLFNGQDFVFASEMKALWSAGIVRKPNLQMLFNFITIGYTDNPQRPEETFFENVLKLPAASRLYYTPASGELTIEKYWDLDLSVQHQKITDKEATEQFRHLFSSSVKRRLRSDVPVGMSLSGGLDSSSIAATASTLITSNASLTSFTAIFPGFEKDESAFASLMARNVNLPHQTAEISVNDFVHDWEKFLYYQEEPFGSASAYAQYKVYELAKQHHVKVLLDGQGADETLAGYNKYYKWYWQELFRKRKLTRSKELPAARDMGVSEKFTYKNIIAALFPDIASVILEKQYLARAVRHEDLTHDFIHLQSKEAYYSTPDTFDLNGALYFNTSIHGLEELLRLADRNSMAHGREVRLPFLQHELVEFVFSLPAQFKIRNGRTKWVLRQSMKDNLPQEIVFRKDKTGFEPPQKEWMKGTPVQEMIQEAKRKLVNERILKPGVLNKPVSPHSSHEADAYDWRYLASAFYL
ncbi:MAG: asparagine synthase (glutamine-hydrolyzing) [Chitinophagaceae bacterium]|nr:asparagine synthase (glutamine-hydrolyzing) [Chitinophagaceae bacterium]